MVASVLNSPIYHHLDARVPRYLRALSVKQVYKHTCIYLKLLYLIVFDLIIFYILNFYFYMVVVS